MDSNSLHCRIQSRLSRIGKDSDRHLNVTVLAFALPLVTTVVLAELSENPSDLFQPIDANPLSRPASR